MPRRDLTIERTEQILDAFEQCILRHGLESSSLEKVAEEAGMKRPIIRHYVGNRDDLVMALTKRFIARYRSRTETMMDSLGEKNRVATLLDILFSDQESESAESVLIFENLILAATRMEPICTLLSEWTAEFLGIVAAEIAQAFPKAKAKDHQEVAWGLVSIYYNHVSLMGLGLPKKISANSRRAAQRLVNTL